jgi:DNA-binding transcriptional regulator YhcF (GntR family)
MRTRRPRRNERGHDTPRHIRLYHWLLKSEAWRSLGATPRAIYIEIASRYAGQGTNNGRIPYSSREGAEALGVSKATAWRALASLKERGFIVPTKIGTFTLKVRHSTEWRLTEFSCDVTHEMPTKDFMRWSAEKQNTVCQVNRTGNMVEPNGVSHETEPFKKAARGA